MQTASQWEFFNTSSIQATIFVFQNPLLCRPDKIIQAIPNSDQNKHDGKLRGRWKFWFWVGRRYYIVNVVDYITNNEYENLKVLVEEEFQIIEENKYKLLSCLLQEILDSTTDDVNIDWESTRKAPNSQLAKTFICENCGKSYRKQKFYGIRAKHGE